MGAFQGKWHIDLHISPTTPLGRYGTHKESGLCHCNDLTVACCIFYRRFPLLVFACRYDPCQRITPHDALRHPFFFTLPHPASTPEISGELLLKTVDC
jgi:hypothetical protein